MSNLKLSYLQKVCVCGGGGGGYICTGHPHQKVWGIHTPPPHPPGFTLVGSDPPGVFATFDKLRGQISVQYMKCR